MSFYTVPESLRKSITKRAVNKLRISSIRSGKASMTAEEIDAEISKARKVKKES